MEKTCIQFITKAFVISFTFVAFYALVVNGVIYFVIKKKGHHEKLISYMKKAFVKLPFLLTAYGFLAGVIVYAGVFLIGALFDANSHTSISSNATPTSDPEIGLFLFTAMGFCMSVGIGWGAFFKAYKTVNSIDRTLHANHSASDANKK